MTDGLKAKLKRNLSPQNKLMARRFFVGAVGACVRLVAQVYKLGERVIELAVTHGLDLRREWDVTASPKPIPVQPFGARDFIMLMERAAPRISEQQALAHEGSSVEEKTAFVRASVIIPVFNQIEFTFQCLRSLMSELDFSETEVIVVDDGSTDETERVLAHFSGIVRYVRNERNLGFVGACNRGAALARGRFLVFLNNDTTVLPGWLDSLVETAERDERVGAVGSLFLYPDGRIQEAGSIIRRDGSAHHYGWGRSTDDKRYTFAREVDYCSGASLLVRRDIFEQLGGFDERYAPAYFEDADLCFGVRTLGRKVVYQPASRLVHFEGATAGTDTGTGVKHHQIINRAKFYEKWREVLERDHLPHDPAHEESAADRRRGPYVFVFDDRILTPDRDAGSSRMLYILRALARWSRPVFIYTSKQTPNDYERLLWAEGVETAHVTAYPRLLKERKPPVVVLSRPHVADLLLKSLRRAAPDIKIVFDMVDAHFIRLEREAVVTGDESAAREALSYREVEARIARESDMLWCASSEDMQVMMREAPGVRAAVIPTIHSPRESMAGFDERRGLLFVGNFRHRPNEDAAHHLMRDIFPLLSELITDVELYFVGDNATPEIKAYASERVHVLGFVPDLEPILRDCRVMLVPLRFGAGVKGKIGEALAAGLPVVTTSVGAESMGMTDGEQALIADDPALFAEAVARAYLDPRLWEKLSRNGREHVALHFSPDVVGHIINNSIREAVGNMTDDLEAASADARMTASDRM